MQTLDIARPNMPDLQFVLLVTALCTSRLRSLNVPESLRTTMFDRCWILIHDTPPPRRPEERVLDLRPWNDVTLEAMVETIRRTLLESDIPILIWDHQPADATLASAYEIQPLIDGLGQHHPRLSGGIDAVVVTELMKSSPSAGTSIPDVWQLLGKIAASMATFQSALERRANEIATTDTDAEAGITLLAGADVMRRSANTFLTLGRHYARLAGDNAEATDDE
ncbi:MAG TPA: hypothetical protein VJ746_15900 [Nitrospira sp.]|nr:hypothetical protein [Nitrospira sp.]